MAGSGMSGTGTSSTVQRAAGIVDVENLLYAQARSRRYLAQQCLAAFVWWGRHVTPPAQITEMGGYAKPWDPAYRAVRTSTRALRFRLRDVPDGPDLADRAVCERMRMLVTTRDYSTLVVGGVDHLVLTAVKTLQDDHDLDVWIVAPTTYQRQLRAEFAPGGRHERIRARAIVWIDEILGKYLASRRNPAPIGRSAGPAPSPFLPAARFWSPLMPQVCDLGDYRAWTAAAKERFACAGYPAQAAEDLSEALWIGLHAENGMSYTGRDPLARRDWAKICLATLIRTALADRPEVSTHVIEFAVAALESGYQHVQAALAMANETADDDADEAAGPGAGMTKQELA